MWFLAILSISSLLMSTQAQGTASFYRGNNQNKRCQYSFTVDSPTEASCPSTGSNPEIESLKSRLGLMEALVARLTGVGTVGNEAQRRLQEDYNQAIGMRDRLQQDKESLTQQVDQLQQLVEELQQEAERLRRRCSQQSSQSVPVHDGRIQPGVTHSHVGSRTGMTQGDRSSLTDPSWTYGSPEYQELKAETAEFPAPETEESKVGSVTSRSGPSLFTYGETIIRF